MRPAAFNRDQFTDVVGNVKPHVPVKECYIQIVENQISKPVELLGRYLFGKS